MKNLKLILLVGMLCSLVIISCRKEIFTNDFDEQAFFENTSGDKLTAWAAQNLKEQNNTVHFAEEIDQKFGTPEWNNSLTFTDYNGMPTIITPFIDRSSKKVSAIWIIYYQNKQLKTHIMARNDIKSLRPPRNAGKEPIAQAADYAHMFRFLERRIFNTGIKKVPKLASTKAPSIKDKTVSYSISYEVCEDWYDGSFDGETIDFTKGRKCYTETIWIPETPVYTPPIEYPTDPPSGGGGGTTANNPPKKTPCDEAKELTMALNEALAELEIKGTLDALKGKKNDNIEHGFLITKDANGFHATPIVAGTTNSVGFTTNSDTEVIFVAHVHPPNTSAAPSSTDILALGNYGPSFEGNIIIHGDDMYLVSITDEANYVKFAQKSSEKDYHDKDSSNGWKKKSSIADDFDSFTADYTNIYKGVDATFPAQLHLINRYKMGITVQKWDEDTKRFKPQKLDLEYNNSTGSSSTIGGSGNAINSKYKKIEVSTTDCPN